MAKVVMYTSKDTGEKESVDSLLRRFKKAVTKEDILYECKKREYFMSKSLKRKMKYIESIKRAKRKASKNRKNK